TRTIKGHFAGWFDSVSEKFHSRIVNNRNRFKDVDDTADDDEIQEAAKKTGLDGDEISQSNTDGENKDEWDKVKEEEVDDGKGGKTKKEVETGGYNDVEVDDSIKRDDIVDDTGKVKGTAVDTAQNRMSARAQKVLSAGGELLNASQMVCGFMKTIGAISAVATAIQRANIINYVTASLEMIQKTQAGDGGNEIHYLMNGLSQKGDTTGVSETGEITTVKSGTAAMESPAFNHFFGGSPVSASDPVARKYNTDNSFSTMLAMNLSVNDSGQDADEALVNRKSAGGFWSWLFGRDKENQYDKTALANGGVKKAVSDFIPEVNALLSSGNGNKLANYKKCLMMRASAALTDIVSDVITLVTTGPLAFFKQAIESVVQMAIRTMLMTAVSAVISAIVPRLVEWLAKDMMTNMMGEDAAYALDAGVHMYLGEQEQSSTGKPGTEAEAIAMHNATQQIIAEEARYDRLTHSPFDITNKNTFMGSIVYSLIPIGLSLYTSPTTLLSRATSTVGSALNSILPAVSAVDEGVHFKQELNNDCPSLSEFGLVGDAYCSPYYVSTYASDNVLLETDPYDIFKEICDGNFENNCDMEDGGNTDVENPSDDNESTYGYNPKIKKDSDLGKWVVACSARTTQFGYVDGQEYQLFSTGNGAADTILNVGTGMIPILGSLVDLGSSAEDAANIKWSSGEECLSDRSKLYSAYSEDQRWMENAGIVEDSAIAVYLDDWYKEHPLDNSEEGIIARYSGLTIDQVEETLGMVELYDFVANYDPSGLGPKVDAPVAEDGWQYDGPGVVAELFPEAKVAYYIVYSDLRSRTVIV
ncbi:hypothetical protein IJG66_01410, partial [Candidatus Saccharibacteria bacterium]|nr:hypothetical protein [Candidatus Saccharibacteria bacterium]